MLTKQTEDTRRQRPHLHHNKLQQHKDHTLTKTVYSNKLLPVFMRITKYVKNYQFRYVRATHSHQSCLTIKLKHKNC